MLATQSETQNFRSVVPYFYNAFPEFFNVKFFGLNDQEFFCIVHIFFALRNKPSKLLKLNI